MLAGGLLAVASLTACGSKESTSSQAAIDAENKMGLTARDTTITLGLVDDFMHRLIDRDVKSAEAMLYTVDFDDKSGQPYPITDEQIAAYNRMLSLPVTDYEIAEYIFSSADQNEVRCRVYINNISTNWYFKPVRYLGNWYLCIKDSAQGDRSLNSEQAEIAR